MNRPTPADADPAPTLGDDAAARPLQIVTVPLGAGGRHASQVRLVRLIGIEGPDTGRRWTASTARFAIGNAEGNDVVLDDPTVSRFHCELTLADDGLHLRDLGSRNGTVVAGVVVRDATLRDGQVLQLGRTSLRVMLTDEYEQLPLAESFGRMCGRSLRMRRLFAQLEKVASSRTTLLLEGETGTGKTAAAESIHLTSPRQEGPFVVVDCGAVPPALLESELFGHEKGAFTGAHARRIGAFEAAHDGTLFLDEIGELPLDLQPKLLRALESRTIKRVGSSETTAVDVRVVAATNRDLRADVNAGRFRADLYYRLAVITLRMPPLRERPEDIPDLVTRLLDELEPPAETRAQLLAPASLARLVAAPWKGNVRELRNHVERCLVLESGADDAPDEPPQPAGQVDLDRPYAEARQQSLELFERQYVERLLQRSGGRVAQAARDAGLNRTYLHRLISRHK